MRIVKEGHLTPPRVVFEQLDREAAKAAAKARIEAVGMLRAASPGSLGGENTTGTVRKTLIGWELEVGPKKKVRWRARFPEKGTKGPIRRRQRGPDGKPLPFRIGNRFVDEVSGQRAQRFIERTRPLAAAAVARVFAASRIEP